MPKTDNEAVTHIAELFCKSRGREKNGGGKFCIFGSFSIWLHWLNTVLFVTLVETKRFFKVCESVFKISKY